jgi:hypothetical protein
MTPNIEKNGTYAVGDWSVDLGDQDPFQLPVTPPPPSPPEWTASHREFFSHRICHVFGPQAQARDLNHGHKKLILNHGRIAVFALCMTDYLQMHRNFPPDVSIHKQVRTVSEIANELYLTAKAQMYDAGDSVTLLEIYEIWDRVTASVYVPTRLRTIFGIADP